MPERKITIEQQADYVLDLRAMWQKVARIHGYTSRQEVEMLDILCREDDKLDEMRKEAENESA